MKILIVNKFLFPKGGDAIAAINTGKLLEENGHKAIFWGMKHPDNGFFEFSRYFVDQADYHLASSLRERLRLSLNLLYSLEARNKFENLLKVTKPDCVHLHNFSHQISPSILHACYKFNLPVVMTMHDYKLVCASYLLICRNKPCALCRNGRYYHCFLTGCVKKSRTMSLLNTLEMYMHHKLMRIYSGINIFISPSNFLKNKLEGMGFKGKITVLPNFTDLTGIKPQFSHTENSIVYFGRLAEEKGILTLLAAMKVFPRITLKIIGEGPARKRLEESASQLQLRNVRFLGFRKKEDLNNEIAKSLFAVAPSEWYENNPLSVIEAFSLGKPVIASRIGGLPELVIEEKTGFTFKPGDTEDLKEKIFCLLKSSRKIEQFGRAARSMIESNFTPQAHYRGLMEIYASACKRRSKEG